MPKVTFKYDLQKDAWSWVLIAKDKNLWGLDWRENTAQISDELMEKIQKTSYGRAEKLVQEAIMKDPNKNLKTKVMRLEMQALEKSWRIVEKKYFNVLEKITKKPILTDKFTCYYTTGMMCPYMEKENWFMASMWHSIPNSITTICHEIMHLQFLHYYRKFMKKSGLSEEKIQVFKEALTFLLNDIEFERIILCEDNGYPEHKELRNKLQKIWSKEKDFDKLVEGGMKEISKSKF